MDTRKFTILSVFLLITTIVAGQAYCQDESTTNVLKQGLLGAGTGAIAAGASGGKAGQGALIGAGTGVIGSVLLDALTTPSGSSRRASARAQDYYEDDSDEYYEEPAQESSTQKVLKQGLLGAGTGAIASGASGGNAGTGALIGAGTGIIGGALLDAITQPSQPKKVYRKKKPVQQYQTQVVQQPQNIQVQEEQVGAEGSKKKIVKHYDASGKLVSEEEIYY